MSSINAETSQATENKSKKIAAYLYEWLDSAAFSMFTVILLFTFFLGIVGVEGSSMENTLFESDKLIISHFNYTPKTGDIVIISRNYANDEDMQVNSSNKPIVKRIIAVEGQKVQIKDNKVFINDVPLEEDYTKNQTFRNEMPETVVVPEGHVFVLGDNREYSHDSRAPEIGMVDTRYILGKAIFRIYPFDSVIKF